MAKLIIDNLTLPQAETLAEYLEGQGESDYIPWFENNNVTPPMINIRKLPWKEVNHSTQTVKIYATNIKKI